MFRSRAMVLPALFGEPDPICCPSIYEPQFHTVSEVMYTSHATPAAPPAALPHGPIPGPPHANMSHGPVMPSIEAYDATPNYGVPEAAPVPTPEPVSPDATPSPLPNADADDATTFYQLPTIQQVAYEPTIQQVAYETSSPRTPLPPVVQLNRPSSQSHTKRYSDQLSEAAFVQPW